MRTVPVLFLVLLISFPTISRTLFIKSYSDNGSQESTSEEERQERSFAIQVIKRLNVTDEFAPLMREFFIKDFLIHFRYFLLDKEIYDSEDGSYGIERRAFAHATYDDLRRAYVALMDAWNQYDQLHDATYRYVAARENVDWLAIYEKRFRRPLAASRDEALTPQFFSIANTSPLLSLLVSRAILKEEVTDVAYNKRLKDATIRTVSGLRAFITRLTKCVDLMREAVRKLRADLDKLSVGRVIEAKRDRDTEDIYKYWTDTLEKKVYGFRAGTKLIYARIYPFEIVMTRRHGRLRVVAVYPDFDGD